MEAQRPCFKKGGERSAHGTLSKKQLRHVNSNLKQIFDDFRKSDLIRGVARLRWIDKQAKESR